MRLPSLLSSFLLIGAALATQADEPIPTQEYLWYKQPAGIRDASLPWGSMSGSVNLPAKDAKDPWESQSLPIGNGRVGGTIFGGDKLERVSLNEVSLWTGGPNLPGNGSGYAYGPLATRDQFGSYQPFGNLYISFDLPGETQNYRRSLNLKDAIARVSFKNGGASHKRECFVSYPDNVLVYMAKTDSEEGVSAKIALTPYHKVTFKKSKNGITMGGTLNNGEVFEGQMLVLTNGGSVKSKGKGGTIEVNYVNRGNAMAPSFSADKIPYIEVEGAREMYIYISLATDYKMKYEDHWKGSPPASFNANVISNIEEKRYEDIRKDHILNHKKLSDRLSLSLGKTPEEIAKLPTDERKEAYKSSPCDPELEATVYQYGRYALICGSRPGNLPVNLQGIWNDKVHAPWACDYHNNINVQMCYWGTEVGNLSECHLPFLNFMKAMEKPLTEMTAKHFGASIKGWTTRISQNPWGGGGWTEWNPPVNAWYALHIWDHYAFTQDKKYLKNIAYPMLRNICAFWETRLKPLGAGGEGLETNGKKVDVSKYPELKGIKAGALVSPNSWSHEWVNSPHEDGVMHDQQLIWELFDNTIKATKVLGTDAAWAKKLANMRDRLVPNRVSEHGYLQEWIIDRPELTRGHRHTSHLIGVFPGSSISMSKTPELAKAAAKSLELRGSDGDSRRSWTWPWRMALWARLGETQRAYDMVQGYIRHNMLDNMLGNHPPMQMDGTYGMTGAMSEMLLQSHAGQIHLLPALPSAWRDGYIKGICARGGLVVDIEWKNGKLTNYKLSSRTGSSEKITVIANGKKSSVKPGVASADEDSEAGDAPKKKSKKKGKKKKSKKKKKASA